MKDLCHSWRTEYDTVETWVWLIWPICIYLKQASNHTEKHISHSIENSSISDPQQHPVIAHNTLTTQTSLYW